MYPKISDLINDLFGTDINLPIQSYGLFLALAFLTGAWLLYLELNRKEKEGLIVPQQRKVTIGAPAKPLEVIAYFVFSFIAGWKIIGFFADYSAIVDHVQAYITSWQGSWLGGLIFASAYTGYFIYVKRRDRKDPPVTKMVTVHAREQAWPILFIAIIAGILGAKVFHWLENWDEFTRDPLDSLLSFNGMTFYGGLIIATFSILYYGNKKGIRWIHLMDAVAPSLILAYGIGRIGCHLAGDGDWGIVNDLSRPDWLSILPDWAWSYTYPHNILNEGVPIPGCTGPHCFQLAEGVFPTPVYETTMALIIFSILWMLRKRISFPGGLFAIYLMFNGTERFLIEKIRINNTFPFLGMEVTQAEVISTILFITGVVLLIFFYKTGNTKKHGS